MKPTHYIHSIKPIHAHLMAKASFHYSIGVHQSAGNHNWQEIPCNVTKRDPVIIVCKWLTITQLGLTTVRYCRSPLPGLSVFILLLKIRPGVSEITTTDSICMETKMVDTNQTLSKIYYTSTITCHLHITSGI